MSEVQAPGKIVQCIGAVVDVEFPRDAMPKVYDALKLEGTALTLEVQQQLGDGVVRTIALGSSDGLRRGLMVSNTGDADHGAGGQGHAGPHHGRAGQPDRRARPGRPGADRRRSTARPPAYDELSPSQELLETGIKVIDLICPFAKGGKVGLFGGAGVGKTVNMMELINNIAKAHSRPVGVRRRGRAHPRGQRLLSRDGRLGRRQPARTWASPRWRWSTAR